MKYTINIMLGKASSEALLHLHRYIRLHANEEIVKYFTAYWLHEKDNEIIFDFAKEVESEKHGFIANESENLNYTFETILSGKQGKCENELIEFTNKLWRSRITANHKGDRRLGFCIYVPLYEPQSWNLAKLFIEIIEKAISTPVDIDIIGFAADLAAILDKENNNDIIRQKGTLRKNAISTVKEIAEYRKNHSDISNFFILKNQTNTYALDFSIHTLCSVLAEYAMMCIENYSQTFGSLHQNGDVGAMGLSIMTFDKYYFTDYLIAKSFLYLTNDAKINMPKVDLSKCAKDIDNLLASSTNIMTQFYDEQIMHLIAQGKSIEDIMPIIRVKIEEQFKNLNTKITDSITRDDKYSLPEKKAMIATLLGEDDELFGHTTLTSSEQTTLADLEKEYLSFFINENNAIVESNEKNSENEESEDLIAEEGHPEDEEPFLPPYDESKKAISVIDKSKDLRYKQRNLIADIRRVMVEVNDLKRNLKEIGDADKCLIEGGKVHYKGREYKLLPQIDEIPLTETYVAHYVSRKSVDLSDGFMPIKDQGQQGACVAFTFASIFEYFLKQNAEPTPDLSEQFLYYNARMRANATDKDEGSNMYYAVTALTEDGICKEDFWKYDPTAYSVEPSTDAYEDAKQRKVRIAKNVKLNRDDIRSALADGFPVAFAIKIYDSFQKNNNGFISFPTTEEIAAYDSNGENHSHAMVICGYNDDEQLFKVRNSWGSDWGDNGYCYLPYAYIENKDLSLWACAIEEIAIAKILTGQEEIAKDAVYGIHISDMPQLKFAENDINIQYALRCNLLNNLQNELVELEKEDKLLRVYHEALITELRNSNHREQMRAKAVERRKNEQKTLEHDKEEVLNQMQKVIRPYKLKTIINGSIVCGILLLITILAGWLCSVDIQQLHGLRDRQIRQMVKDYGSLEDLRDELSKSVSPILVSQTKKIQKLQEEHKRKNYSPLSVFTDEYKKVEGTLPYYLYEIIPLKNDKGEVKAFVYADKYGDDYYVLTEKDAKVYYNKSYSNKPPRRLRSNNKVIHEALLLLYPRSKWMWLYLIPLICIFLFAAVYFPVRIMRRKDMEAQYYNQIKDINRSIANLDDEIAHLPLQFALAGEMLNGMFDIKRKMNSAYSASGNMLVNLKQWSDEVNNWLENAQPENAAPFISLQSNNILDKYFDLHAEKMLKNINIYNYLETYRSDKDDMLLLQQKLREDIALVVQEQIKTFNMADYILHLNDQTQYTYLKHDFGELDKLLENMDQKAELFVEYDTSEGYIDISETLLIHASKEGMLPLIEKQISNTIDGASVINMLSDSKIILFKYMNCKISQIKL